MKRPGVSVPCVSVWHAAVCLVFFSCICFCCFTVFVLQVGSLNAEMCLYRVCLFSVSFCFVFVSPACVFVLFMCVWFFFSQKDKSLECVLLVLTTVREDQIDTCLSGLSLDEIDVLVKYVYKGLGLPRNNGPLFKWHAKVGCGGPFFTTAVSLSSPNIYEYYIYSINSST